MNVQPFQALISSHVSFFKVSSECPFTHKPVYSAQMALFPRTVTSGALNDDSSTTQDLVAMEPSRTKSCSPQASGKVCDSVVIHCKMDNLG